MLLEHLRQEGRWIREDIFVVTFVQMLPVSDGNEKVLFQSVFVTFGYKFFDTTFLWLLS
jgi:hypothetical protein